MRQKITNYYQQLSYHGKFKLIINLSLLGIAVFGILMAASFAKILSDEIYEKNREKLTFISKDIESEFITIENLTTEIHQNSLLQENLTLTANDRANLADKWTAETQVASELNWLLADKENITKAILFNQQQRNISRGIYNEADFFDGQSLEDILGQLDSFSRQGKWFFDQDLNTGLFMQNINSTKQMHYGRIGILFVFVDLSFIQNKIESADLFHENDFYFLEYEQKLYTSHQENKKSNLELIKRERELTNFDQNRLIGVNGLGRYFVDSTEIDTLNNQFRVYYFLRNNHVIFRVILILLIFLLILSIFMLIVYVLCNRYITRLTKPINNLVEIMKRFKGEEDLRELQGVHQSIPSQDSKDEIGELYSSFQLLISQIDELVIKDYQSELLAREMEFKFLQAQLDPHFLYNALNSINWMAINRGDKEISEMVTSLATLFRKKLEQNRQLETVEKELALVQAYVHIQMVRFKSRVDFSVELRPELERALIPPLTIQPLIENAFKYAVEKVNRPITIKLKIYRVEDELIIKVIDDGPGFDGNATLEKQSTGLGIDNIRSRLQLLYGTDATLTIYSQQDQLTLITIQLPLRFEEEVEEL